jgi:hypothetical protein
MIWQCRHYCRDHHAISANSALIYAILTANPTIVIGAAANDPRLW